jgi:hypothetical protein
MQTRQNMDVILNPADPVQMAVLVTDNAPNVFVQFLATFGPQHPLAILGRENDVIQDLRERGHLWARH